MGQFTWTLADKTPRPLARGGYDSRCLLPYGGYGAILCPDGTLVEEPYYDGYGMFGDVDAFDLVAEWNRDFIPDVRSDDRFKGWPTFGLACTAMALAWAAHDDVAFAKALDEAARESPILKTEWKRTIGIWLAAENNAILPFPLKIVGRRNRRPYADLPPSIQTQ